MSEDQLIGIIYSQLLEEFGFGYSEKDLWMIAENIAEKIVNQIPQLNDNQKIVFDYLKSNVEQGGKSVMYSIFLLGDWDSRIGAARNVDIAYCGLNGKQEAEVLAAFAQWGLEQEEA
ncbi:MULTISPECIES: hypothetical protein [Enterobacteriaceae]|nr:hypothetical protein [Enterococcus durans]